MVRAGRLTRIALAFALAGALPLLSARLHAADPLRVVLLVDSSTNMSTMLTEFRAGLNAFIDNVPPDVEVAIVSTGGQLRIRVPPTTDSERLHREAARFASDGGANSIFDTLIEADRRFLRPARDRRGVFVLLTTDQPARDDPNIDRYNSFMRDFVRRGGRAHGIVIRGSQMGIASEIVENLVRNTDGLYQVLAVGNSLASRMRDIAAQVSAQD